MDSLVKVLAVDDEPGFAEMVAEFLEQEDEELTVDAATSAKEGLEALSVTTYDCIVSD